MHFLGVECHAASVFFQPQRSMVVGGEKKSLEYFRVPDLHFLSFGSERKLAASNLHVCNHTTKNLSEPQLLNLKPGGEPGALAKAGVALVSLAHR